MGTVGLALLGCARAPAPAPAPITTSVERGPFRLTVQITPAEAWVGDPITIELRVQTPERHVVQFPDVDRLGALEVRQVGAVEMRAAAAGGLLWRRTITAEAYASGQVELPPLAVKYAPEPAEPGAAPLFEHELASEPLKIAVRSALTSQDSVLNPRDITGTLAPAAPPRSPWFWAAVAGAAVAGAALLTLLVLRLRRLLHRPAPPILPEVWALRALAQLEAADLLERGQAREFYYRLSEIVRYYIELKFGLAAPDMTTEEFLLALARRRGSVPYDAGRLRHFMQACDLVKYAALLPRAEDAGQALGMARAFVDATAAADSGARREERAA